ncbi:uncharacterized protein Dwil_GK10344 [Drosophila willistoni]|uniref:LIM zinc-binding domain-containing protein n=1 Tax=Drosophila willistoni TaxID=7260 RepID=B4MJ80_DROWI|nr:transforming growth factor beta-1-induced transcript 1 protein [Drosophila willistoni]EDW72169.1 uncharacterized protein Dwil_GK10344 [Drosophila willistoni]
MATAICCKCNEVVKPRVVSALGKTYHPHHFTCKECEQPIGLLAYSVVDDEPVCNTCYREKHASRCYACGMAILQRGIIAVGRKWHEKCFRCVSCSKSLVTSTFFEVNGYLFCKLDFRESLLSRCAGCAEPIDKNAVVALNTKWHSNCFKCCICHRQITGYKFSIRSGRAVCIQCANYREGESNGDA